MRLHRFFVEQEIGDKKTLEIKEERILYQWRNVLRFSPLDKVILFDGKGSDFLCEINILTKNEAKLSVLEKMKGIISERKITLFVSLIKRENFELVLEKATELGVSHIVPVVAERSEKKSFNYERSAKIIVEASEQSGRADIPVLSEEVKPEEAVNKYKKELNLFAFDPTGSDLYKTIVKNDNLGLFIGPEGGFTLKELDFFKENEIPVVKLCEQILRAETASIVAISLITF
ncbi:MAG: 16S rRNA (uracil1498-N3)-methyltransferase [Parcubacteria group bacterium LiPW_30]|nr:MAG: 16S rRNA (uracil1498-N3)-methyltransferase [Parcubacteria group bacterium LiPW_30]